MRILQVGSSMPVDWGGIERYVAYLSQGLSERGHDLVCACPAGSPLAQRVSVPVQPILLRTKLDPLALAAYLRLFRQQRFDIVNVHFSPDYAVPALAAKLCRQPNVVLTRHLAIGWNLKRVRSYQKMYSHIIAVSQAVREVLVKDSGFAPSFVTAAQAGIPAPDPSQKRAQSRAMYGMDEGTAHVGVFGRLTVEKGHRPLIDVIKSMDQPPVLHIFGSGPEMSNLRSQSQGMRVVFHGQVADVANALDAVDIVATPSLWAEAFSLATLEAFALARPVIASPRGALPELVEDGVTGFLADPEHEKSLFRKRLTELSCGSELRQQLGQAARDLWNERFQVRHFAERIEAVYQTVAG